MSNEQADVINKIVAAGKGLNDTAAGRGVVEGRNINAMLTVSLKISAIMGYTRMPISSILNVAQGTVIELDRDIGQPIDILVEDTLIARGNLVRVGENGVGVTLTEIVQKFDPAA